MHIGEGISTYIIEHHDTSTSNLVQQLFLCGLVHCYWIYPIERYMKTLKDHVRTLAHLEGRLAEGYRMEDTLGFMHKIHETIL